MDGQRAKLSSDLSRLEAILRDVAGHTDEGKAAEMMEAFDAGAALCLFITKNQREAGRLTAFHWEATKPVAPESKGSA
jgi:hypothetical protein